ncbi:ornithine cyclodeaminase [Legionella donaldsonii]|uniref:Ornithine cyclodeaminase n=1 Tax=Legionella donaldsonii TaxID=45060 RepID=A0A378J3D8_9GAMM|nr:ornithine cyclodeaminase family protein [Legionella donaldsonii]STX42145.1 ornithine cyclodeaminase [Legionella donaldsonii]
MKIIALAEIKELLHAVNLIPKLEEGFVAYSMGNTVMPPVGELCFTNPPGDVHIKYGYIKGDEFYVVKIASGFYENPELNLPSSHGLMLLFSQKTGVLQAILLDEGYLTDVRTAVAGAIAAKYLAPRIVDRVGIVGTGTQARLQLYFLQQIVSCKDILVWGRDQTKLLAFQNQMQNETCRIKITQSMDVLTDSCNLIVTTTPSSVPILFANQIRKGTHITAVGADTPLKQELDENIFAEAELIITDSISQSIERGDVAHALRKKIIAKTQLIELGAIIAGLERGRSNDKQITIADLTGLAVQDLQIAKAVYERVS